MLDDLIQKDFPQAEENLIFATGFGGQLRPLIDILSALKPLKE